MNLNPQVADGSHDFSDLEVRTLAAVQSIGSHAEGEDDSHAEVVDGSHAEVVDGSQAETSVILDRNSSPSPAPNTPGSRISPGTSISPSLDLQSCASPLLQQALLELVRLSWNSGRLLFHRCA